MPLSVYHIANNETILPVLMSYFSRQEIDFQAYPIQDSPQVDFLLLVEPVRIGKDLYSISNTWKPWLMMNAPTTRLIVGGYAQSPHPNCLNLLNLPMDINLWLEQIPTVSMYRPIDARLSNPQDRKTYVDPWGFDLVRPGKDHNQQMRKFFQGHGTDLGEGSFFGQVSKLRKYLMDLHYYHSKKSKKTEEGYAEKWNIAHLDLMDLWAGFSHRWHYYGPFFEWFPAAQKSTEIIRTEMEKFSQKMISGIETGVFPDTQLLDNLIAVMKREMIPFIFSEEYW